MAELADALDLGSSTVTGVGVRVPVLALQLPACSPSFYLNPKNLILAILKSVDLLSNSCKKDIFNKKLKKMQLIN
jgi:hypothetical protein